MSGSSSVLLGSSPIFSESDHLNRKATENLSTFEVEIISNEFIKPATPTPQDSRTYEVSIFDQVYPNIYLSFVYFYPNNHHENDEDLILKRRQLLKQSLSETLTKFYPLAGRFKDSRHIDCNDDGIYYVEAKVDDLLSDFLKQPENKSIHRLLPLDPSSEEQLSRNDIVMIQATVFGCGGLAIGLYTSHKIMDGYSIPTFFNSWAATAAGAPSDQQIHPTFMSSKFYPSDPTLPEDAKFLLVPQFSMTKLATRRFLFGASSLATLKQRAESSRVLAVTALIWKRAVTTFRAINATPISSNLMITVNLRNRYSPPTPPHSIGNIVFTTLPIHCSENEDLAALDTITQKLKSGVDMFSSEFLEMFKANWLSNAEGSLNEMKKWAEANKDAKTMMITSFCRSERYDADFGWGKPIWVCVGNGDSRTATENLVMLMDTRCGTGIEAWVTLGEEEMKVFESDPEILAFASLNASPLQLVE